ncbi:hypothetical protein B0H14DRAFT_2724121, partial [Mycena olivaceomarginata]
SDRAMRLALALAGLALAAGVDDRSRNVPSAAAAGVAAAVGLGDGGLGGLQAQVFVGVAVVRIGLDWIGAVRLILNADDNTAIDRLEPGLALHQVAHPF